MSDTKLLGIHGASIMKSVIIKGLSVLVALLSLGWAIYDFTWEPIIVFFVSLIALLGTFMNDKKELEGKGGNAIVGGKNSDIEVFNEGEISAGEGGTGGNGGDAFHVSEGVKVKIINQGVIRGGNAGK